MNNDMTNCPNCRDEKSVTEGFMEFYCVSCGHWGPSRDKIIYEPMGTYRPQGQVARRPAAA